MNAPRSKLPARRSPYERRAALVIGIDEYEDSGYPNLRYATRDAHVFAETLTTYCGFNNSDISILLDRDATLQNIRLQAELIGRALPPEKSQLIVFFAGHGDTIAIFGEKEIGFFVPYDANGANIYSTCISMQEIVTLSEFLSVHHILFILDCCFSGLVGVTTRGISYADKLVKLPSRQIMTAGLSNEYAAEDDALGHGLYTYWLCKALSNPNLCKLDQVTASTLHTFLAQKLTEQTTGAQTPQIRQLLQFGEGDNILLVRSSTSPPKTMNTFSPYFRQLYTDSDLYVKYSSNPPFNLACILPYRSNEKVIDETTILQAEKAILIEINEDNIKGIISTYKYHQLLSHREAEALFQVLDFFDEDFFEIMGSLYLNAGMFKCALRWYGEMIRRLEKRAKMSEVAIEESYDSVGYCLLSLVFF